MILTIIGTYDRYEKLIIFNILVLAQSINQSSSNLSIKIDWLINDRYDKLVIFLFVFFSKELCYLCIKKILHIIILVCI